MKVITKPRFLEDAISKSFKAQEENKQIMRENQALNKKLMKIAGKQVRGGEERIYGTSTLNRGQIRPLYHRFQLCYGF